MTGRQGGKLKPMKAPKAKTKEKTPEEIAHHEKEKANNKAVKEAREKILKKKWITFHSKSFFLLEMWEQLNSMEIKYNWSNIIT